MSDLAGSGRKSEAGGLRISKGLLAGGAVVYLVSMGLLQYDFSRISSWPRWGVSNRSNPRWRSSTRTSSRCAA